MKKIFKMKKISNQIVFYLGVLSIFLISLNAVSAEYILSNYGLDDYYAQSSNIKGWLNISFNNEPSNSVIKLNDEEEIRLLDLIKLNPKYNYNCDPLSCKIKFTASNAETLKVFNLNAGQSKAYGLFFQGDVDSIGEISLSINSDVTSSCINPLNIDFFDDGISEIVSKNVSNELCNANKIDGCFESATQEYSIGTKPYCQKISLPEAPGLRVGAWVKEAQAGSKKIIIELFKEDGTNINAKCELTKPSTAGEEVNCDINKGVSSGAYYLCIYSQEVGNGDYRIQGNPNQEDLCGFFGYPSSSQISVNSYNIFAQTKQYGNFGTVEIQNILSNQESLSIKSNNYINNVYGNDCAHGCVIPIRFTSKKNQTITLSNLNAKVSYSTGLTTINKFYDITESPALISSEAQKLFLDNSNLTVSNTLGNQTIELKLNEQSLLTKNIQIEQVATINLLTPSIFIAGNPTSIKSYITLGKYNITSYTWEMGNGDKITNKQSEIIYSYNSTGNYQITLTLQDAGNFKSSRTFNILVQSAREAANETLISKLQDLEDIKSSINDYDEFTKSLLENELNIVELEDKLKNLQREYSVASINDETKFSDIMQELNALEIPSSIITTQNTQPLEFYFSEDAIDLEIVSQVAGGKYEGFEEEYINGIYLWNQENSQLKISTKEVSAIYNLEILPIVKIFDLQIQLDEEFEYDVYLFIEQLENLKFKESYKEKVKASYNYLPLTKKENSITFSTTEEIEFVDLPVFVSPGFGKLGVTTPKLPIIKEFPLKTFFIVLGIIIMGGIVGYFALHYWYKSKYEGYLFRNKRDLYNILQYIHYGKRNGLKDAELENRLKNTGWKKEQINYAIKKYKGENTGIPKLRLGELGGLFKKKANFSKSKSP